jgi:hypothetical protein
MSQFPELFSNLSKSLDNLPNYYYLGAAVLFAVIFYLAVKR